MTPPPLELPDGLGLTVILLAIIGPAFGLLGSGAVMGLILLFVGLLAYLTCFHAPVCFPRTLNTVADLVIAAAPMADEVPLPGRLTRTEVGKKVRQIISDVLNVDVDELHDDVEFVRDLKVD